MKNKYLDKLLKDEEALKKIIENDTTLKYVSSKPEADPVLNWTDVLTVSCTDSKNNDNLTIYLDEFSVIGIVKNGERVHQDQAELLNSDSNMWKVLDNFTIHMIKNCDEAYFKKLLTYREQLINYYLDEERKHHKLYEEYKNDTQISEGKRKMHLDDEWQKSAQSADFCDLEFALQNRAKMIYNQLHQSSDESGSGK